MFTGIITAQGKILSLSRGSVWRLRIAVPFALEGIDLGASIACNGICLSVVAKEKDWVEFEAGEETLKTTTLKSWQVGQRINLERALRLGDELGGHIVTGHVDGIGVIRKRTMAGGTLLLEVEAPGTLAYFIAGKGSITMEGVSLTVNRIQDCIFSVGLVPITQEKTNLADRKEGDIVNLEIDVLARYVARLREEPK